MKVIAVNGSPRQNGNTYQALQAAGEVFQSKGIAFEVLQVGGADLRGCIACGTCSKNGGHCVFADQQFEEWMAQLKEADGILLASPVYYASIAGGMKAFLDRAFYSNSSAFYHKVGGAFAVLRRTGGIDAYDELLHYMTITEMLVAPMKYWGVVHGAAPGEVLDDQEGLAVVRRMAENMVWLMELTAYGKGAVQEPAPTALPRTNFIR